MQDVVYLLWTSLDPAVLQQHEDQLLQYYVQELYAQLHTLRDSKPDSRCKSEGPRVLDATNSEEEEAALDTNDFPKLSESVIRRQYEVC